MLWSFCSARYLLSSSACLLKLWAVPGPLGCGVLKGDGEGTPRYHTPLAPHLCAAELYPSHHCNTAFSPQLNIRETGNCYFCVEKEVTNMALLWKRLSLKAVGEGFEGFWGMLCFYSRKEGTGNTTKVRKNAWTENVTPLPSFIMTFQACLSVDTNNHMCHRKTVLKIYITWL